jgi:tRNA threonylcarbamoyladenosine biosynthesis protein TsaB
VTSLFIDSTYDITIGILGEDLEWLDFKKFTGQKASSVIQKETHAMLGSSGKKLKDLQSIITIAGPGFYTGLRLSEGFADVLKFSGIKHYSLLSYSIPRFLDISSGIWMTKAYRGEYFFHSWDTHGHQNLLVSTKELEKYSLNVNKSNFYIHSESGIDEFSKRFFLEAVTTHELLKTNSKKIFTKLLNSTENPDSFYFRAPEDEFKVST